MAESQTPAPEAPAAGVTPETLNAPEPEAAPWGDDFDAARAWKTITSQREEAKELKVKLAAFERAQAEKEDAEKTELERLAARLAKAEADLQARDHEAAVAKIAKEHGIPDGLLDLLSGDDEAAVTAKAVKLAETLGSLTGGEELPGRPKPRLIPGDATHESSAPRDPSAIAKAIRAGL